MQLRHLGGHLGRFPVGLASRASSSAFRWAFWIHGLTNAVVSFQLGEVFRHSRLCEFHSCRCHTRDFVAKCHTRDITRGESLGDAEKSQVFSSMHICSQNTLGSNMEAPNLFFCPGRNLNWIHPSVTPWTLRKNPPSLVLAPELMFFRSFPKIHGHR